MTDEEIAEIRKKARQEVFREFVIPFCNEILKFKDDYDDSGSFFPCSSYNEALFDYINAVKHYICYGELTEEAKKSFTFLFTVDYIDRLDGKLSTPKNNNKEQQS